jgi:hypothetical protein
VCADEDWDEAHKFEWETRVSDQTRDYPGGLQIITIGKPLKSDLYLGWYVPYEIKLRSGEIKKWNLPVRNDNPAKRYVVDGGI